MADRKTHSIRLRSGLTIVGTPVVGPLVHQQAIQR
jgi:hypothetical protein